MTAGMLSGVGRAYAKLATARSAIASQTRR